MVGYILGSRFLPGFLVFLFVSLVQFAIVRQLLRRSPSKRPFILACAGLSLAAMLLAVLMGADRIARHFPSWWTGWGRGIVVLWAFLSVLWAVIYFALQMIPAGRQHSPARRGFLLAAKTALFATPVVATGYGVFIQRFRLSLREADIPIPHLHPDLEGLRLVQVTDIHLSEFLSERELARAIAMANETKAHVALVTGDLITGRHDPLDACIRQLATLRADAGILGCLGNHEAYATAEEYTTKQGAREGLRFLRQEAIMLRFGKANLNFAGVDYQRFGKPYLVGADKFVRPDSVNILLSHNPDVFPVAAKQGYQATVSGHTHGGQVRFEVLHEDLNIARFFTKYVDGLYQKDGSSIFVSRGIGTIGMPARLGAPPEVALLRLRRA